MRSTPLLIEARPLRGYTVHVGFEDGTAADLDPDVIYGTAPRDWKPPVVVRGKPILTP